MSSLPEEAVLWFAICFFCFFCFLIGWRTRAVPRAVVRDDDQPAQPHPVRRELGRRRDRRADDLDGVPAAGAPVLGRRGAGQHARAAATRRPRSWRPACRAPDNTPGDVAGGAGAAAADRDHLLVQLRPQDRASPGRTGPRSTTCCTRSGSSPGWACGCASTSRIRLTKLLTHGTLVVEAAAAVPGADAGVLARGPGRWRWCCWSGLHVSIAAMVNLGIFSAAMIAFYPFLIDGAALAAVRRGWCRASGRARTVFYDVDCGVCFFIARVLARLDVLGRLRWLSNRDRTALPRRRRSASCSTGRSWWSTATTRRGAGRARTPCRGDLRARCRSGGCGRGRCGVPGVSAAGGRRLRRVRAQPDAHLGLAGAGGVWRAGRAGRWPRVPAPSASRRRCAPGCARAAAAGARAGHRRWCSSILAAEVSVANPSVPRGAALRAPARVDGGGGHVPAHLRGLVAVLARGAAVRRDRGRRRRDARRPPRRSVQRGRQPRRRRCRSSGVPVRLGHDSFWCDYTLRIPDARPVPPGVARMDPALSRADRAPGGPDRPLRGVRASGRTARSRARRQPTNFRKRRFLRWPETAGASDDDAEAQVGALGEVPALLRRHYMTVDARSLGLRADRAGAGPAARSGAAGPRHHAVLFERRGWCRTT